MKLGTVILTCGLLVELVGGAEIPPPEGNTIVSPEARLELLFTRTVPVLGGLTEGPAVAPDGSIYFSDLMFGENKGIIHRYDPKTNKTTVFVADSYKSNGLIFDADGHLVACEGADFGGRQISRWNVKTVRRSTVADRYQGKTFNAPNDLCLDSKGRIYFTDPRYIGPEPRELEHQAIYRIDNDGTVIEITHDVDKPNGIALSPDEGTLYVAEHDNGTDQGLTATDPQMGDMKLYAFPLDVDGRVSGPRKEIAEFGREPGIDGMTVDEHGNVYLACIRPSLPGVVVLSPEGNEIAYIPTAPPHQKPDDPEAVGGSASNVEFGIGDEANVLYITVDTSLYRIPLKVKGHHPQQGKGITK